MIKKFFKNHKIHNSIVPYFDVIFLVNLPYFFILWVVFCWGMAASYFNSGISEHYYFLTSFNNIELFFFIGLTLFLSGINIAIQRDDLHILDWNNKSEKYELNLKYTYVSPNFISLDSAKFYSKIYSIIGFLLIAVTYISIIPFLVVYYLLCIYINNKLLKTLSFNIFIYRCIFKIITLYLLFLSGWVYLSGFDILGLMRYFILFLLSVTPIVLINEVISFDQFSDDEKNNRRFIKNNKKIIALISCFIMIISFIVSFYVFYPNDPIVSHFSIITIPFLLYAVFRSQNKDFIRSFRYPLMVINILISWTLFPFLLVGQFFVYYLSKYYFWHRFNIHFPTFLVDDND